MKLGCNKIYNFKYNKIDFDQIKYLSLKLWGSSLLLKKRNLLWNKSKLLVGILQIQIA